MKKLLGIAVTALILAACSSHGDRMDPPQGPEGGNAQVEEALKACRQSVGEAKDQTQFDACMQEKGFTRPAEGGNPPQPQPQQPQPAQ